FKEALQKALRSLEIKRFGLLGDGADKYVDVETLRLKLATPNAERIFFIAQAFQKGTSIAEVYELTKIDRWFLRNVQQIVEEEKFLRSSHFSHTARGLSQVGKSGFQPDSADEHLARRAANPAYEANEIVDIRFRGLDPQQPIVQKRGHLPHWEQT